MSLPSLGAEAEGELLVGVGLGHAAHVLVADGALLDLLEEQAVLVGEVRAEAVVEALDDLRERGRVLLGVARADLLRACDVHAGLLGDGDHARRDALQAVVLELHVVAEVDRRAVAAHAQVREQRAAERGEAVEVGVGVGDDLAEEGVEVHERAEAVSERRLLLLVERGEAVAGGL